ncbi:hypothetical protein RI367_005120 [Sorochytrium milnesiophthora]
MPTMTDPNAGRQGAEDGKLMKPQADRKISSMISLLSRRPTTGASSTDVGSARRTQSFTENAELDAARMRIGDLLLADDLDFLSFIFQSTHPQVNGSGVCHSLLELIQREGSNRLEDFLRRIVREKFNAYVRDNGTIGIKNILRDNSLQTLFLSAYMATELNDYLEDTLSDTVNSLLETLENCEIDPYQVANGQNAANEARLQHVCTTVLRRIVNSYRYVPKTVRRLCAYIKAELERVCPTAGQESASRRPGEEFRIASRLGLRVSMSGSSNPRLAGVGRRLRGEAAAAAAAGTASVGRPLEATAVTVSDSESIGEPTSSGPPKIHLSDIPTRPQSLVIPGTAALLWPLIASSVTPALSRDVNSLPVLPTTNTSGTLPDSIESPITPVSPSQIPDSTDMLSASAPYTSLSLLPKQPVSLYDEPPTPAPDATASTSSLAPPEPEEPRLTRTATSLQRNKAVSRRSMNKGPLYTLPEQILATFLFLRVYVPALTLPEQHKILPAGTLRKEQHRGLVLCGKMLVSFCGEGNTANLVSPSSPKRLTSSESLMGPPNQYFRDKQIMIKHFVACLCRDPDLEPDPEPEPEPEPQSLSDLTPSMQSDLMVSEMRPRAPAPQFAKLTGSSMLTSSSSSSTNSDGSEGQRKASFTGRPGGGILTNLSRKLSATSLALNPPPTPPGEGTAERSRFGSLSKFTGRRQRSAYGLASTLLDAANNSSEMGDSKPGGQGMSVSPSTESFGMDAGSQVPSDELVAFLDKSIGRMLHQVQTMPDDQHIRRDLLSAQTVALGEEIKRFNDLSATTQTTRKRSVLASISRKMGLKNTKNYET